jgi:hypothetical protein
MRMRETLAVFVAGAAMVIAAGPAWAQGPPSPGPTRPSPPPLGKPQTGIVINPTAEECRTGWNPSLAWTREQFESFCAKMKAAR